MPHNPLRMITLGCKFVRGQYPEAKTEDYPQGLYFHGGRLEMPETHFKKLMDVYQFRKHYDQGSIFLLKAGQVIDIPTAPKVVSGSNSTNSSALEQGVDTQHEQPGALTIEFDPDLKEE